MFCHLWLQGGLEISHQILTAFHGVVSLPERSLLLLLLPVFSSLVQNYVKTIRSGKVPCIDNTVIALAATENEAVITAALAHYEAEMRKLQLPVELDKLLEAHGKCEEGALKLFMEHSFRDSEQQYQKQLVVGGAFWCGSALL